MARPDQKHDKAKRPARRMAVKARQVQVLAATRFDIRSVPQAFKHLPVELLRPGMFQTRRNFKPRAVSYTHLTLPTKRIV